MLANFLYSIKRFLKNLKVKFKNRIRLIFRSVLVAFGLWVLVFANYGFVDYYRLQREKKDLVVQLKKLENEKEELLKLVRAISGPEIDIDLLEMQARKVLAYARENEQIVFWK